MRAALGAAAVLVVLGAVAWNWLGGRVGDESTATDEAGRPPTHVAAGARGHSSAASAPDVMEIDLLGTRVDAARLFSLRFAGGLYLDADTRATLDTLLVALSGEPTEAEWAKFESTLRRGLPHEDAEAALRLFQNYKDYLADVRTQAPELGIPANANDADAYFDRLAAIQRRHFDDATANALFEQETRQARAVMKASLIEQDESLSWEQKRVRLDALRAQLPQADRTLIDDPPRGASEPR